MTAADRRIMKTEVACVIIARDFLEKLLVIILFDLMRFERQVRLMKTFVRILGIYIPKRPIEGLLQLPPEFLENAVALARDLRPHAHRLQILHHETDAGFFARRHLLDEIEEGFWSEAHPSRRP